MCSHSRRQPREKRKTLPYYAYEVQGRKYKTSFMKMASTPATVIFQIQFNRFVIFCTVPNDAAATRELSTAGVNPCEQALVKHNTPGVLRKHRTQHPHTGTNTHTFPLRATSPLPRRTWAAEGRSSCPRSWSNTAMTDLAEGQRVPGVPRGRGEELKQIFQQPQAAAAL